MCEQKENTFVSSFFAILGGVVAMIASALILYPLEMMIADRYLEFHWGEAGDLVTRNDLIFFSSVILWFSIAAFAGGLISSLISRTNEIRHAWILFFLFFIILVSKQAGERLRQSDILFDIVLLGTVCLMFQLGARKGIILKQNRKKKKEAAQDGA